MAQITAAFRQAALRRGIVVKPNKTVVTSVSLAHAASIEMANLGFIVSPQELDGMSTDNLNAMIKEARTVIGADRNMVAIYPGFPQQVEALDTMTLLVEQILHYWTAGAFLPNHPTVVREGLPIQEMLKHARKVTVLSAAETARKVTRDLVTDPVALSEDDTALLEGALALAKPDLALVTDLAKAYVNGENLQTFLKGAVATGLNRDQVMAAVAPEVKSADHLLRAALALYTAPAVDKKNGETVATKWLGNYQLAVDTLADRHARAVTMAKVSKPVRRLLVSRLGDLTGGFKADSLVARRDLWRKVMRAVHPYDLSLTEASRRAVDVIHTNGEYRTLNSQVEEAMATGQAITAITLLRNNAPGNLLRRSVALMRLIKDDQAAAVLADAVRAVGGKAAVTTLISAYNGVLSANDDHARVTRVAGLTNTMVDRKETVKVSQAHLDVVLEAFKDALRGALTKATAPTGPVAVQSTVAVPLVRRDAATTDRVLDRGQEIPMVGEGDTLRIFGHWNNNKDSAGYMDIGIVALDEEFNHLAVSTWNSWSMHRAWSTYSGDKLVYPGDNAPEFFDVKVDLLKKAHPTAKWVAMTVQSYSGWPIVEVDFLSGAMLRTEAEKGDTFDGRTVVTAFKPTTVSTQAVPFAVNLETGNLVWIDSSNGSTASGSSSTNDDSIGSIVYDEIARPRLTMGELAALWAEAHGVATTEAEVDRDQVLALLG